MLATLFSRSVQTTLAFRFLRGPRSFERAHRAGVTENFILAEVHSPLENFGALPRRLGHLEVDRVSHQSEIFLTCIFVVIMKYFGMPALATGFTPQCRAGHGAMFGHLAPRAHRFVAGV